MTKQARAKMKLVGKDDIWWERKFEESLIPPR
jgi:hypothetical protein